MNTNQVAVIVSALVIVVATSLILRYTPIGLATGSPSTTRNAEIAGVNTEAVTAGSWMVGIMLPASRVSSSHPSSASPSCSSPPARRVVRGRRDRADEQSAAHVRRRDLDRIAATGVAEVPADGRPVLRGRRGEHPFAVMLVFLIVYSFTSSGLRRESFEIDRRAGGGAHGEAPAPARTVYDD
jgi:hypothetical protein